MSLIDAWRHRLRSMLSPASADRERDEEHAFHQALDAQQRVHDGESPHEARYAARRQFGNTTYLREEARWMGITRWVDAAGQDLRYGWRALRRSPVFAVVATLSLGLGIGANAVIFGLIHSLLLARLPVDSARELRIVSHGAASDPRRAFFTAREIEALRAAPDVGFATISSSGVPRGEINGVVLVGLLFDAVDGAFFGVVRPGAAAGRLITDDDQRNGAPVVVASHAFATARFGSADAAVGKSISLGGAAFTVIGVTKAGYKGLSPSTDYELAIPSSTLPLIQRGGRAVESFIVLRLDGDSARTHAALDATFNSCCANGELADPNARRAERRIGFVDISRGINEGKKVNVREQYAGILYALMGGIAVLLLIACANVGNLLMARAAVRGRELAVRLSLGASRGRLVRQLLVEALLLALLGGATGLVMAIWGSAFLSRDLPGGLGVLESFIAIRPGATIFAFTGAVALGCAIIFGIAPALRATG
jgi:hypothetical protein